MARHLTRRSALIAWTLTLVWAGWVAGGEHPASDGGSGVILVGDCALLVSATGRIESSTPEQVCLGCHDGVTADALVLYRRPGRGQGGREPVVTLAAHMVLTGPHPVDVRYPDGEKGFHRREELDARIRLIDGRVTCATCHPGDRQVARLGDGDWPVMPCLSCHDR